jgi:hypothetical protein
MPLIAHIRGKDPSSIQMKSGVQIPRATLNSIVGHMEESRYIERFSIQKEPPDNLVLTIYPKLGFHPELAQKIQYELASLMGAFAEVSVQIADSPKSDSIAD